MTSPFDEPAALIYCPFRALLHLLAWADRRRTFERVTASLRPGGRWSGQVHPKGAFRLLGPLITWMGRRQERRIWASLKRYLEHTAARPAP